MTLTTEEIADLIYQKILENRDAIKQTYLKSQSEIGYFFIDNLLPESLAMSCFDVFPDISEMKLKKSLREFKYVSAQMDKHNPLLESVIFAFQDPRIIELIGEVCEVDELFADDSLYAGGLSLMHENQFLNPHLDNSHDAERSRWRVLNLLYYVTPDWKTENGGHLELWPEGPSKAPVVLESKFNRLCVMATHDTSWHSVSKVEVNQPRCCISNYYFSNKPLREKDQFHVTTFRARPNDYFTNVILNLDSTLRMGLRKVFKKGVRKNPHIYKKD